jgi:hypothetical protein
MGCDSAVGQKKKVSISRKLGRVDREGFEKRQRVSKINGIIVIVASNAFRQMQESNKGVDVRIPKRSPWFLGFCTNGFRCKNERLEAKERGGRKGWREKEEVPELWRVVKKRNGACGIQVWREGLHRLAPRNAQSPHKESIGDREKHPCSGDSDQRN